jgi:NAD(P)-dependent dehydrogenase (short-subunit alcohol dehydrogenase family)
MDVTKEVDISAAVQSAASKFGGIDISIHGAGITGLPAATQESSFENWQPVIDINLTGVMLCDKWMVRQMLTQE